MACGILANKPGAPTKAIRVRNISPNKNPEHGTHGTRGTPCPMSIGTHRKPILTQGLWEGYGSNGGGIVEFPLTKDWSFQRWVPGGRVLWESFFMSTWDSWRLVEGSRGFSLTAWNLETPQLNSIERPWHFMSDFDSDTESLIGLVDSRLVGVFRKRQNKSRISRSLHPFQPSWEPPFTTQLLYFSLVLRGQCFSAKQRVWRSGEEWRYSTSKRNLPPLFPVVILKGSALTFKILLSWPALPMMVKFQWTDSHFYPTPVFFCKTMLGRIIPRLSCQ